MLNVPQPGVEQVVGAKLNRKHRSIVRGKGLERFCSTLMLRFDGAGRVPQANGVICRCEGRDMLSVSLLASQVARDDEIAC